MNVYLKLQYLLVREFENIDRMKYDTLKLILKKYQGSIKIIHENQNINISLLIPVSR